MKPRIPHVADDKLYLKIEKNMIKNDSSPKSGWNRRTFLKGALGSTLLLSPIPTLYRAKPKPLEKNPLIPKNPYPKSDYIKGIKWLTESLIYPTHLGDVWQCSWANDGNVYTSSDDSWPNQVHFGPNMLKFALWKITGNPPDHKLELVNDMKEYYTNSIVEKASGFACIDGVLYMAIYCQTHPNAGSPTKLSVNANYSTLISSSDYGKTWRPNADFVRNPYNAMFESKAFPTPNFVQFGKDYSDAIDDYVYMISNDGGWSNWNRLWLARAPRDQIKNLNKNDWEFFAGKDKQNKPIWSKKSWYVSPVFRFDGYTGMVGMQYIPAIKRFILPQWSFVSWKPDKNPDRDRTEMSNLIQDYPWGKDHEKYHLKDQTMLNLYEAPHPWGPWKLFHTEEDWGTAYYCPSFPSKWIESDGSKLWIVQGGHYKEEGEIKHHYRFVIRQLELLF